MSLSSIRKVSCKSSFSINSFIWFSLASCNVLIMSFEDSCFFFFSWSLWSSFSARKEKTRVYLVLFIRQALVLWASLPLVGNCFYMKVWSRTSWQRLHHHCKMIMRLAFYFECWPYYISCCIHTICMYFMLNTWGSVTHHCKKLSVIKIMLSLLVFVVLLADHYICDLNRPFVKANRASTAEPVEAL